MFFLVRSHKHWASYKEFRWGTGDKSSPLCLKLFFIKINLNKTVLQMMFLFKKGDILKFHSTRL